MIYDVFPSPMGDILISSDGETITTFGFMGQKHQKAVPLDWLHQPDHSLIVLAKKQTDEYFSGKRKKFDLPLSPQGTSFQKSVWEALAKIPYGQVISYATVARQIGNPKAVRAVGSAIGRNPIGIIIPCHRVIGSNKKLTGYAGGLDRKQSLLALEGMLFR